MSARNRRHAVAGIHRPAHAPGRALAQRDFDRAPVIRRHDHHIAGPYLGQYAREASWREDNRRVDNGTQAAMVTAAAMEAPVSRTWKGYWQRSD